MVPESLERLLNRFIAESTPATNQVREMDGTSLAVEVAGLPLRIVMSADNGRVGLSLGESAAASVTVKASPLDLLQLLGPDTLVRVKNTRAQISGDLHVAEAFGSLLAAAKPDLEEELARWIGDIPAHRLGQCARAAMRYRRTASRSIQTSVAEYLHAEARLLPTVSEIETFCAAVDDTRDDVARLEQRIDVLVRLARAPS